MFVLLWYCGYQPIDFWIMRHSMFHAKHCGYASCLHITVTNYLTDIDQACAYLVAFKTLHLAMYTLQLNTVVSHLLRALNIKRRRSRSSHPGPDFWV